MCVLIEFFSYLNVNSLMSRHQSAYRRHHSTEAALAFVFSELISALDDGNLTLMALLDLSAAFDCVDHDILLSWLNIAYGIENTVNRWMSSYLSGRTQSVRVDGASSRAKTMQYGVLHGSVLGPLLFLLYTVDLCWRLAVVSILSSGLDPTAADHHDRVYYGPRLMNEVEQAATESCKDKVSVARNTATTWLFQRQFIYPWQHHRQAYHHENNCTVGGHLILVTDDPENVGHGHNLQK